jgi:hypothetical protein
MFKALFALTFLLSSLCSQAQLQRATLNLPTPSGEFDGSRVSYIEYSAPTLIRGKKLPVLLLAPGVNRGILNGDALITSLTKKGYGIVAMHFSTLPHSVSSLAPNQRPYFDNNDFGIEDYAFELEAVANWARQEFSREVIPVSLSFSGAPSSLLSSFETIIDLAPMTSLRDARPNVGLYLQTLRTANFFNPFASAVIRSAMDQSYYTVWRPKTDSMIQGYGFERDLYSYILEGYMTSSRALEDFEWSVENTPEKTTRAFFLAENESDSLLSGQTDLLEEYFSKNKSTLCFFIRGADHAISFSHPETTANLIHLIVENKIKKDQGCYDVSSPKELNFINRDELNTLFR